MNDLRFAFRQLSKNPGFAAITVATLALGIAGNMVIFTIYNSFYLRPFAFTEPDRLVDLDATAPRWNLEYTGLSYPEFAGWREHSQSFEAMAAYELVRHVVSHEGSVEWVNGARVSHELTSVLKIQPILGRGFTPEEDRVGGPRVVLLAHGFWQRRLGAREEVVGQTLRLNQKDHTIVGVLPPNKSVLLERDYWVPLAYDTRAERGWHLRGIGRLKPGIKLPVAREDLGRVHQTLVAENRANENTSPRLTSLSDRYFGDTRLILRLLLGAVVIVLLIACGNVGAMMLARGLARAHELRLRLSLGATRRRLGRLIAVESLLLAGLGGFAGMVLGKWGVQLLLLSVPEPPPQWVSFAADWRVWLFVGLMVAGAALLGALPVIRSIGTLQLHGILQSSTRQSTTTAGGRRSLHALVVAEVTLTVLVMIQAGLLVQTFRRLQNADPGYRPDHVLVYDIALPEHRYPSRESQRAFFEEHLGRLRGLPGIASASAIKPAPLGGHWGNHFAVEDAPPKRPGEPEPVVLQRLASPGYFATMGIPILAGRAFTDQDGIHEEARVVIVNETFARGSWPDQEPVGKRIRHDHPDARWMMVIGVVRDVKQYGLDQPVIPGVYLPFAQDPQALMTVVIRSSVSPTSSLPAIRALVRECDPELPISGVATMEERLRQSMWTRRLTALLFGIFSGVALLMAAGGIYGVFSYVVSRRTQEIGVRLALGAQRAEILWPVIRHGLTLSGVGIGIGLVGAMLATPVTRHLLYGVSPFEPFTIAAVTLGLALVAVLACWIPARRATTVDPVEALRCE